MNYHQRGETKFDAWFGFCVSSVFFVCGVALLIRFWLTGYAHFNFRGIHFYGADAVAWYRVFAIGGAFGLLLSRKALVSSAR